MTTTILLTSATASVAIETHGCKLNQADSEGLARRFVRAGYRVVDLKDGPDVYVLNSCTVTHVADAKARQALRAARRRNPGMTVVATGCYAQRAPERLRKLAGVDLVIGNFDKPRLVEEVGKLRAAAGVSGGRGPEEVGKHRVAAAVSGGRGREEVAAPRRPPGRVRAMVKIQEGCDQVCAYCIVPKVRGRERSVPVDELVNRVRRRVEDGYREVVLTGTQLGSYGFDLPGGVDLRELIDGVLTGSGVERLRVSSLQPQELTPALLELWRNPRLCPHFHLPLQSGSDPVLRRMRRRYTAREYRDAVSRIYGAVPQASVTADVIVGFPGETDADHAATVRLLRGVELAGMHVFPYSVRPGTTAAHLPGAVAPEVKRARMGEMLALVAEKAASFRRRAVGSVRPVLWERAVAEGVYTGLTDNYLRVEMPSDVDLTNRITDARLVGARDGVVVGRAAGAGG